MQTNKKTEGGLGRREKEGTALFSVTDRFRITTSDNLISEIVYTDGSAFFIGNVNKHSK